MRSLLVVLFIAAVGATAGYFAQRTTYAKGSVLAADLLAQNKAVLRSLDCDEDIPIYVAGATFTCRAEFQSGEIQRVDFKMDRAGRISQTHAESLGSAPTAAPNVNPADPWD